VAGGDGVVYLLLTLAVTSQFENTLFILAFQKVEYRQYRSNNFFNDCSIFPAKLDWGGSMGAMAVSQRNHAIVTTTSDLVKWITSLQNAGEYKYLLFSL
jgi:hypothetical protein